MLADDLQDMPLEAFLAEVGEWTLDVYVPALGRGERLQPAVKPPFSFPRRLVASCGSSLSFQRLGRKLRVCVCVFVSCQEHAAVAQGLARYTGLSLDFVEASNLRIDDGKFRKELRKNTRNVLGAPPPPPFHPSVWILDFMQTQRKSWVYVQCGVSAGRLGGWTAGTSPGTPNQHISLGILCVSWRVAKSG